MNSALKVLLGLDIFPRVPKKKLNFVDQCYQSGTEESGDESEDGVSEDELEICDYQSGTEQSADESEDGVSEVLLSFTVVTSIVYNPLPAMWKS